jgi:UDP-GlcNAc:undecaprenyl-phosphate GlcNAc-1-phosphate transferase
MLRWIVEWVVVALAAVLVMATGTRFGVLGVRGEGDVALGAWSGPLTVLWLVAATGVARLLDGLEGAVNVLLLVAGVAVAYGTLGAGEPVLNSVALVVVFASLGSLRFNFFPAPLPLRGTGSAVAGFMFAVLTVMARQKTVAALLLIFPLAVVVVLVGGVMLGVMERTLLPEGRGGAAPEDKKTKSNPPEK